jgi:TIR domain
VGQVFISYKREDLDRVAPIVDALRDAGIETWWDRDIPPGAAWRQTIVDQLDSADLCIVAWSEHSTAGGGRWVIEEAERAAARHAYLGILIDPVLPPFGFTESHAIDLSGWRGKAGDPRLHRLVETVQARLRGEMSERRPPARPVRRRRGRALPWVAGIGAALLIAAALALWWFTSNLAKPIPKAPTDFVNEQLGGLDCTWAQISSVPPPESGLPIQLSGLASSPPLVHDLLVQRAQAEGVPLADVDVRGIIQAPAICPQINAMRAFRVPNSDRFQVSAERGSLQRSGGSLSGRVEIQFDLTRLPAHAALLGLDDVNGLEVLMPEVRATPGATGDRDHPVYTSVYDDEGRNVRNVGLILVVSDRPMDLAALLPAERPDDPQALARLADAARAGGWKFELGLVRCGFDSGMAQRC